MIIINSIIFLQVISLTLSVAHADIGLKLRQQQQQQGYNYQVPETSYGVPSYQVGSSANSFNYNQGSRQGPTFGQNAGFQTANRFASGQQYPVSSAVSQSSSQVQGAPHSYNQFQTSNQYQSSVVQKHEQRYNDVQKQPPQIFKHFYIHAAPEEPEVAKPRQHITLPPPQKHYKIIFIKTPIQPPYIPPHIPVPEQNEEKTIVYVLVQKPEEQPDIVIPKVEPKPPSKPEVFFIKYNSKEGSKAVIDNIVTDYNKKGDSVNIGELVANSAAVSGGSSQYTHGSGSGQYTQAGGSGDSGYSHHSASAIESFGPSYSQSAGSSSFGVDNVGSKTLSVATTDSNIAGVAGDNSGTSDRLSSAGVSVASTSNFDSGKLISTSQGVPHETYGTPTFRA